ncbi:MAG: hypothetical protein ACRDTA_23945, partial [Pseudonocardiaceae bacterium]
DALGELTKLTDVVPSLVATARPGPAVEEYLRECTEALSRLTGGTTRTRTVLAELRQREAELRARVAEHEELLARVTELRRLERLAGALDELQAQREVIDARLAAITAPVIETEQVLGAGAVELVRLTEGRWEALQPAVRASLEQAAEAQARLQIVEQDLRGQESAFMAASARHDELRTEHELRVAALRVHTQADREVADALAAFDGTHGEDVSGLGRTRALLDDVDRQLREADVVLARILGERQQRAEQTRITWSGAPAGSAR